MKDDADFEAALRETLPGRAAVGEADVQRLRDAVAALPSRRRGRRGGVLLGVAAGIIVALGLGGLLVTRLPVGTSGAGPHAPDPAAFAFDPRLAVCGLTSKDAEAIFEMEHVRDYPLHLPHAHPVVGLQEDPDAPALVIVRAGPASLSRLIRSPDPSNRDLCMVVGSDAASWSAVDIADVDTSGLLAYLPEPTGTPFADELAHWAERCGGADARILDVYTFRHGSEAGLGLALDPSPPELATDEPVAVIVYVDTQPFAPLGTPPADGATIGPREPLAPDHHDICVLVGADPSTATRTIHEDVVATLVDGGAPSLAVPSIVSPALPDPSPSQAAATLPTQIDPADCRAMKFTDERCVALVEHALVQASLDLSRITHASIGPWVDDHLIRTGIAVPVATVRFTLTSGRTAEEVVWCGMGSGRYSLVCTENPEIQLSSGVNRDIPCAGEAPPGDPGSACATPMPAVEPSAEKRAVPLEIQSLDIPITSVGHMEIDMGRATIPNGVLSESTFTLADVHTRTFTVADGIGLEVRSLDPSRPPFYNIYTHGWYPGTEDVEVFLVMDVTSFTPGAMLQVRDLVVR